MTLLICPVANASQIIEYTSNIDEQGVDWAETLQIQQFDPSLGDLISATVFINAGYYGKVNIVNDEDFDGEFTWLTTFDMDLELPNTSLLSSMNLISDSYFETGWILAGESKFFVTSANVFDLPILEEEPLNSFLGVGTIDLPVWTDTFSHLQIYFLNGSIDYTASAWASVTVTYIFDGEVPTESDTWSEVKGLY
ncbi:choice-of-anchor E domain-containing protein [bacterium]|nr:choice-of-anchor E domain-containing protein [bacterium]